jgi:N-acetylmuramoyl-L-alanine amidase
MAYQPRIVPKRKRRIQFRVLIPALVLISLSIYMIYTILFPREIKVEKPSFTICDYNLTQTQTILYELKYDQTLLVSDYLIYGETLNLFHQPYVLGQTDFFIGKTVILRNLCDQSEWVYMLDSMVDGQIPLENLPEGFYELFIVDQLIEKRLIASEQIYDYFYTLRRDGTHHRIDIVADDDLIEADNNALPIMDKVYFFLRVKNQSGDEEALQVYDVTIDPAHFTISGGRVDNGRSAFDLVEAQELLRFSLALQEYLERYGLKVHMTRTLGSDPINLYGSGGRLEAAYQAQSKHYLEINMNFSTNRDTRGSRVVYSSYASNKFASAIFRSLSEVSGIVPYGSAQRGNIAGVIASSRFEGFDSFPVIRESGGRILGAGTMSEQSRENAFFNAQARQGMQTLVVDLIFISNELDVKIYQEQFDRMVEQVALGYLRFVGIQP